MLEISLDHGEMINSVETKTNDDMGRLFRIRFGTTKNKTYDSRKSRFTAGNYLRPWDVEDWPHNNDFEQSEALALAYCSGGDEEGCGVGRILSFHWVAREDVAFPALARRISIEEAQTTQMEYQIKHITI